METLLVGNGVHLSDGEDEEIKEDEPEEVWPQMPETDSIPFTVSVELSRIIFNITK